MVMEDVFLVKEHRNYNLKNQTDFVIPQVENVNYSLESIPVLRPKIWETLPDDYKNKESVDILKKAIKNGNLNHILGVFLKLIYITQGKVKLSQK